MTHIWYALSHSIHCARDLGAHESFVTAKGRRRDAGKGLTMTLLVLAVAAADMGSRSLESLKRAQTCNAFELSSSELVFG